MSSPEVEDDDSYSQYLRGDVREDENDSCGLSERGSVIALRVRTRQGKFGFAYHGYCGHDEDAEHDNPCWLTLYFRDTHERGGKTYHTDWRVKVKGKRLENVIRHISLGRRTTLKEGGSENDPQGRPFVSSITMEAFEPDHLDDE